MPPDGPLGIQPSLSTSQLRMCHLLVHDPSPMTIPSPWQSRDGDVLQPVLHPTAFMAVSALSMWFQPLSHDTTFETQPAYRSPPEGAQVDHDMSVAHARLPPSVEILLVKSTLSQTRTAPVFLALTGVFFVLRAFSLFPEPPNWLREEAQGICAESFSVSGGGQQKLACHICLFFFLLWTVIFFACDLFISINIGVAEGICSDDLVFWKDLLPLRMAGRFSREKPELGSDIIHPVSLHHCPQSHASNCEVLQML